MTKERSLSFVIVHGAFQSSAAWTGVVESLRRDGHTAIAVELPGRNASGLSATPLTLADHVRAVRAAIDGVDGKVVLVGHSFGGMVISLAAEVFPQRISRLIYVAAFLPQSGDSLQTLSATDPGSKFSKENFVLAPDYGYAEVLERDRKLIFANDAAPAQAASIAAGLLREPLAPMAEAIILSAGKFGAVPKSYISTLRDNAVSPTLQKAMIARAGAVNVSSIDAGHAVSITQPEALSKLIEAAA